MFIVYCSSRPESVGVPGSGVAHGYKSLRKCYKPKPFIPPGYKVVLSLESSLQHLNAVVYLFNISGYNYIIISYVQF